MSRLTSTLAPPLCAEAATISRKDQSGTSLKPTETINTANCFSWPPVMTVRELWDSAVSRTHNSPVRRGSRLQGGTMMLKGLTPLLTPDVLYELCAMGHGDEVVIVDAHCPADGAARSSAYGKLLRMDGVAVPVAI